ncbi:two component transcriptional regulator, LytTR family [Enhydrobacter aerosaccus]|uniref:Two component transcriptional regulator, LytTR family n=1 Tax=Enhydrobacter aerosaccus TaxID=225324 RepID=A0A1T4K8Y9_9HYPH|nr:LytTR family DNA-binding domain-containing protein [Enhydrobacter aerosaccus]SJZ38807.1 two component transcriptional regulator, LytTR family [Enhydrobacter aerosaccus]
MLRTLIVDDEPLARQEMRRLLSAHPDLEIVGEAETAAEAVSAIERLHPQLVFLDIDLGFGNGFDVLAALPEPPVVVFVTAYAEYAVEAFAVDAVDYLLKPVDPARLAESLTRVRRQLAVAESARNGATVIELKTPKRSLLVPPDEIVALRAEDDFTRVFVADQSSVLIWRTLGHFESRLPSPPFQRLSRSLIINRDRLKDIESVSRSATRIRLEGLVEPLLLGRTAATRLRDVLANEGRPVSP